MVPFRLIAAAALLAGGLPAQREALTLRRLAARCDAAGLCRPDGARLLPGGAAAVEFTCLEPVKGLVAREALLVRRLPALCLTPDLAQLPAGVPVLLFLARGEEGAYRQLAGGTLPGDPALAEAARELLAAGEGPPLAAVLAAQLGNPVERISEDALLELFRLPAGSLAAAAQAAGPALAARLAREASRPGPVTTWGVRLAVRLALKEAVPAVVAMAMDEDEAQGSRPVLLEALRRLDPAAAATAVARLDLSEPGPARAAARLLGELGTGAGLLGELARHRDPVVRGTALAGLARTAPDHPFVQAGLSRGAATAQTLARALALSPHPAAARVLAEALRTNPELREEPVAPPVFRAIRPGRR